MTFDHSTYRCGNYSREETIQGRKLFAEIRYLPFLFSIHRFFVSFPVYSPDPYVTVQILGTPNGVKKTRHVPNTSDPEWNETLDEFYIDPKRDHLIEFVLYDLNRTVNEEIGREVFDFYGFSSDTDNNIVISFKNVSHTKDEFR